MSISKPGGNEEEIDLSQVKLGRYLEGGTLLKADEIYPDGTLKRYGLIMVDHCRADEIYPDGTLKRGKRLTANAITEEGTFYESGYLKDGKRTWPDGEIHEGTFDENGNLEEGKKTWPNGTINQGKFSNGSLKNGLRIDSNGLGENIRNGWIVISYEELDADRVVKGAMRRDGIKLEGKFLTEGVLEEGTKTLPNGEVQSGVFSGENKLIRGKIIEPSGIVYEGDFIDGHKLTRGKIKMNNGTICDGIFDENLHLLEGEKTLPSGNTYKGLFYEKSEGNRLKLGVFIDSKSGITYDGEFSDDFSNKLIKGKLKHQGGKVETLVHGLILVRPDEVYPDGRIKRGIAKNIQGSLYDGEFDINGNLVSGVETDMDGNVITKMGFRHTYLFGEISGGNILDKKRVYSSGSLAEGVVEVVDPKGRSIIYRGTFHENGNLKKGVKGFGVRKETGVFYPNGKIQKGIVTESHPSQTLDGEWDEQGNFMNGTITTDPKTSQEKVRNIIGGAEITSAYSFYPDGSLKEGSIKFLNGCTHDGYFDENRELVKGVIKIYSKPDFTLQRRENGKLIGKTTISEGIFDDKLNLLEGKMFRGSDVKEGIFDKNEKLTKGKITLPDGTVIEGDFDSSEVISKGTISKPDKTVIEGDFDGKGEIKNGSITKPDGTVYSGDFYRYGGIRKGTVTKTDGMVIEGNFDEMGLLINGTITKPDGGTIEFIDGIEKILPKESAYQRIKKSVKTRIKHIVQEW